MHDARRIDDRLQACGSTLVVCPHKIRSQWEKEIRDRTAPHALKVCRPLVSQSVRHSISDDRFAAAELQLEPLGSLIVAELSDQRCRSERRIALGFLTHAGLNLPDSLRVFSLLVERFEGRRGAGQSSRYLDSCQRFSPIAAT